MLTPRDGLLGWATGRLVIHDANAPGVIRRLLSSGPMRRQAVFAAIALELASERHDQITGGEPDNAVAKDKAEILREGRAREVIAIATGRDVPDGLLGALERVGLSPFQRPSSYERLIEVFAMPDQNHLAEAMRHAGEINDMMLRVADVLPTWLVHPATLKRLDSIADARGFVGAVAMAQAVNSRLTNEAFRAALSQMREQTALADVISRFIRRADSPLAVPVPADEEVSPVSSTTEMVTFPALEPSGEDALGDEADGLALVERPPLPALPIMLDPEVVTERRRPDVEDELFVRRRRMLLRHSALNSEQCGKGASYQASWLRVLEAAGRADNGIKSDGR